MQSLLPSGERDELVRRFLPLVGHAVSRAARRLPPASVNRDELVSAGLWGLVLAARAHDPRAAQSFAAVAAARIDTAIADDLCERTLAHHEGSVRSASDRERVAAQARHDLASVLHRQPTDAEIAVAFGITAAAESARPVARPVAGSVAGSAVGSEAMELADLPMRLRAVMEAYYLRQLTMAEIAVELGMPEDEAMQVRREAVAMLRQGVALI